MEERIPECQELQDPTADIAAVPAEARSPSPAQAPSGDDAAATTVLSSGDETDVDSDGEFEFPFVSRDSPAGTAALADDLFADGCIRPFYPVFGRGAGTDPAPAAPAAPRTRGPLGRLILEESRARSSSTSSTASTSSSAATDDDGGLEGARPESYCLWTPAGSRPGSSSSVSSSPRPPRKSSSTGSMARWRRISELVVGCSHSDGKEKFLFLPTQPPKEIDREDKPKPKPKPKPKTKPKPNPPGGKKASAAAEVDTVTAAHRIAYSAKGRGVTGAGGAPRRTFLPYREELVGFFANVNGISRSHPHPF